MVTTDTDPNRAVHGKAPATSGRNDTVPAILNGLLGATWRAYAQHHAHATLIEGWGLKGLASQMRLRIADEPVTINTLLNRLGDLHGAPAFTIDTPTIGATVREVLDNDMALQRSTRPLLNAAAEAAAAAHDATSRNLIEKILADEEQHLTWLETEIELCAKLGDALYFASRL